MSRDDIVSRETLRLKRLRLRLLPVILGVPLQIVIYVIAGTILFFANPYLTVFFGISIVGADKIHQDSFDIYYLFSSVQLVINILLCVLLKRITKTSLHFSLLVSIFILSVALSQFFADRGSGGILDFDWRFDFYFTIPHVLAFAQFAVYCTAIHLLSKKCIWNERRRTLAASGIALPLGRFTSWLAWLIAYNIYTR